MSGSEYLLLSYGQFEKVTFFPPDPLIMVPKTTSFPASPLVLGQIESSVRSPTCHRHQCSRARSTSNNRQCGTGPRCHTWHLVADAITAGGVRSVGERRDGRRVVAVDFFLLLPLLVRFLMWNKTSVWSACVSRILLTFYSTCETYHSLRVL